jgi:hypothetical protein
MATKTAPYYLANAVCVISYKLDQNLRFKIKEIEQSFSSVILSQAIGTNVLDSAPPPIPRFTLQSGQKQITISQVSAQLELNFRDRNKSSDDALRIIQKNFQNFWRGILTFKSTNELIQMGMVVTLNRPLELSQGEISQKLFDRFIKLPAIGEVASTSFQVGFLDQSNQIFFNISAATYEMRSATVIGKAGNPNISIDIESLPIEETGIELKLDVNSRPMVKAQVEVTKDLGDMLFKRLSNLTAEHGKSFLEW